MAEGGDGDWAWIVTEALPGTSAVDPQWKADPSTAVCAIGVGLRAFHDALPLEDCPFTWPASERDADARGRAATGTTDPHGWHPEHQHLTVDEALDIVAQEPSISRLVVCDGDSCAPNTLLSDDGRCSGHVDLGDLGLGDCWADVAVATWSTAWNYGPGWEDILLDSYGIAADPKRTAYYRLLWDLGP